MSTERTGGPSRRTWRAAVVVFLVVFLGGLGVSGSNALRSQSAHVTAPVATGIWSDGTPPEWSHPLNVDATIDSSDGAGNVGAHLTWSPRQPAETDPRVQYSLNLEQVDGGTVTASMPADVGTARATDAWLDLNDQNVGTFQLTITPSLDGIAGEETVRTVTVRSHSPLGSSSVEAHSTQDEDTTPPVPEYTVEIR